MVLVPNLRPHNQSLRTARHSRMPGFNISAGLGCNDSRGISSGFAPIEIPDPYTETARAHRYILAVYEPLMGARGILVNLLKCSRPSVEIEQMVVHHGMDRIHRPGRPKWSPVETTFYEVLDGDNINTHPDRSRTAGVVYLMWARRAIAMETSSNERPTVSSATMKIDTLNGFGSSVHRFILYNTWPTKISYTDLDYSNNEISQVSITLVYDRATEADERLN
jgi:hypothetical protein